LGGGAVFDKAIYVDNPSLFSFLHRCQLEGLSTGTLHVKTLRLLPQGSLVSHELHAKLVGPTLFSLPPGPLIGQGLLEQMRAIHRFTCNLQRKGQCHGSLTKCTGRRSLVSLPS
jgi:hypothetical protein